MTDGRQELDEIFTKYTKQVIDMCNGNRPDVAEGRPVEYRSLRKIQL